MRMQFSLKYEYVLLWPTVEICLGPRFGAGLCYVASGSFWLSRDPTWTQSLVCSDFVFQVRCVATWKSNNLVLAKKPACWQYVRMWWLVKIIPEKKKKMTQSVLAKIQQWFFLFSNGILYTFLHTFFCVNVCAKYGKRWVVVNPEHLDQVTDGFHNVFPVWVNKHVSLSQCLVWLRHPQSPTLLCIAQSQQPFAGHALGLAGICRIWWQDAGFPLSGGTAPVAALLPRVRPLLVCIFAGPSEEPVVQRGLWTRCRAHLLCETRLRVLLSSHGALGPPCTWWPCRVVTSTQAFAEYHNLIVPIATGEYQWQNQHL